jgi:Methyltransferase domain
MTTNKHRNPMTLRPLHVVSMLCFISLWLRSPKELVDSKSRRPWANSSNRTDENYSLAAAESFGFFQDISNDEWRRLKQSSQLRAQAPSNGKKYSPNDYFRNPRVWYATHWEPNFSCRHETLLGGLDDGHKWVCDPHRIIDHDDEHCCLVYSIGSRGNVRFEAAVRHVLPHCEIHIFDPTDYSNVIASTFSGQQNPTTEPIATLKNRSATRPPGLYLSLDEVVRRLGHDNRTIDIFKIDCDECEWATYRDWIQHDIRQILVEVHDAPHGIANDLFQSLQDKGYVIFHKEPNLEHNPNCIEYSFLKLSTDFWKIGPHSQNDSN